MRTFGAWMLGAGIAVALLSGCNENKPKPVETAPPQVTAAPPQYPADAGTMHHEPVSPPVAEASTTPEPPPVAEPEPVDTAAVPHKAPKPHKAATVEKPAPAPHKAQAPKESYAKPKKAAGGKTYVVKKGDTLQEISQKYYGTTKNWRRIFKANEKTIGSDPNKLTEGMKITIP